MNEILPATSESLTQPFNYAALSPAVATAAQEAVQRVNLAMRRSFAEVGRELKQVKATLPHGTFGPWLEAEFGWTDRTARRYMAFAEFADANPDIMSDVSATVAYELAAPSTPEPARAVIIEQIRQGENVTVSAVKTVIAEEKSKIKDEARRAKLSPEQRQREDRRILQQQRADAKFRREHEKMEARAARLAKIIIAHLPDDDEEIEKLAAQGDTWELDQMAWTISRIVAQAIQARVPRSDSAASATAANVVPLIPRDNPAPGETGD